MKRIYLDYAASTPLRREAQKAMMPYFSVRFGNPSSLHSFGQEGISALDTARETVARAIGAEFRNVLFTGSATEANNLALRGAVRGFREANQNIIPRVIVSAIEHESVLETAKDLGREGAEVVVIPVDERGIVNLVRLKKELNERTAVVSIMYVNNEIGTVQPIQEIAQIVSNFRKKETYPLFHTDAVQAFNYFDCNVETLGVDMMTLSGHKIGGPKGVGCLYVRNLRPMTNDQRQQTKKNSQLITQNSLLISPIITGGGQEFGLRSGTENVPCIVGFAEAVKLVTKERKKEYTRLLALKKYFWKELKKIIPEVRIYGCDEKHFSNSSPHIINIEWRGAPVDDTLVRLDVIGIATSSGSACASRASTRSHVLLALIEGASRGIRFSFGRETMRKEIDAVLRRIHKSFSRS